MGVAKPQLPAAELARLPVGKAYYTTGEVAKLFGVTPKTVVNWCDSERLACIVTPAGHRRIPVSAFAGGRDYDAQLATYEAAIQALLAGDQPPTGEAIAAQIRARRET